MAATIQDVRIQIGDTDEPYIFSDETIQQALDEAEELLNSKVDLNTALGRRAQKLQASIFLIQAYLMRIKNRPIQSVKEGDISLQYVDLQRLLEQMKEELEDLLKQLEGVPIEMIYDNY